MGEKTSSVEPGWLALWSSTREVRLHDGAAEVERRQGKLCCGGDQSPARAFHARARRKINGMATRNCGLNARRPRATPARKSRRAENARYAAVKRPARRQKVVRGRRSETAAGGEGADGDQSAIRAEGAHRFQIKQMQTKYIRRESATQISACVRNGSDARGINASATWGP